MVWPECSHIPRPDPAQCEDTARKRRGPRKKPGRGNVLERQGGEWRQWAGLSVATENILWARSFLNTEACLFSFGFWFTSHKIHQVKCAIQRFLVYSQGCAIITSEFYSSFGTSRKGEALQLPLRPAQSPQSCPSRYFFSVESYNTWPFVSGIFYLG